MESLLDIRDEVAVARNLVVCVFLAAQAPTVPSSERAALCAVRNAAREKLEAVERASVDLGVIACSRISGVTGTNEVASAVVRSVAIRSGR